MSKKSLIDIESAEAQDLLFAGNVHNKEQNDEDLLIQDFKSFAKQKKLDFVFISCCVPDGSIKSFFIANRMPSDHEMQLCTGTMNQMLQKIFEDKGIEFKEGQERKLS